jgi:hypothetical protein
MKFFKQDYSNETLIECEFFNFVEELLEFEREFFKVDSQVRLEYFSLSCNSGQLADRIIELFQQGQVKVIHFDSSFDYYIVM